MIRKHHIDRFKELIDSGLYTTKAACADVMLEEFPEIADQIGLRYKDLRSLRVVFNQQLDKHYPGYAINYRGPREAIEEEETISLFDRPSPFDGWTVNEKLDAADLEIQTENVRLAKQKQAAQDMNRIERKSFRQHARIENAGEAYAKELAIAAKQLHEFMPDYAVRTGPLDSEAPVGVVQLSDIHFNELIDQADNAYDFEIAAKRLAKYASFVKMQGRAFGIEKIVVCFGGDFLNSDRRLDELLHMATNRARATMLAVHILQQFLMDLREEFFIDCFGITGNEGRAKQELGWGDIAVTDNYDAQIFDIVKMHLGSMGDPGMRFYELNGNEQVFSIHQETFLLLHGHQINCNDQKKVQAIIGQKSAAVGQRITHILAGHIHASLVGDYVSRNASLAGANAYSGQALQLASKAAQNFHVVDKANGGSLFGIKVDVQNVEGIEGYHVIDELKAYNAKSHNKAYHSTHKMTPIVVIV